MKIGINRFVGGGIPAHVIIGRHSSIGPLSVLRSCVIENEVIVGERCIIQEGAVIESQSRILPGSVIPPDTLIPAGTLYGGNPVQFIKNLSYDEKSEHVKIAEEIAGVADMCADQYTPGNPAYLEAEKLREKFGIHLSKVESE